MGMNAQIAKWCLRALALPFFGVAFLEWIGADYGDTDFRSFAGQLTFENISQMFNWLFVCVIAFPGAALWAWSDRFRSNSDSPSGVL